MQIPCTTKAPKMVCFCCHRSYDGETLINENDYTVVAECEHWFRLPGGTQQHKEPLSVTMM